MHIEIFYANNATYVHLSLSISLSEVSSASELSGLQRDHPVVFLLVHDGERDPDWHYAYAQVAQAKGLIGKFAYTTSTSIVQVYVHV